MELIRQNYGDDLSEDSSDSPPRSSYLRNKVGDLELSPRVGQEYQVEVVPSIIKQSERLQLLMNPAESEVGHDNSIAFAIGLPVPVTWILNEVENSGHEVRRYLGDNGKELKPNTLQSAMTEDSNSDQLGTSKKYTLVPGTSSNSWSDSDAKSFLLGLYFFGKNFDKIERFIENKRMGEMLAFYYGKFYKSDEYRRWSAFRKTKGNKSTILLTVRRERELMTRLTSHVSDESKHVLRQVQKSYTEWRECKENEKDTSGMEKYISDLKSIVGLGALVEAVGIGKENEDLTCLKVEPRKMPAFQVKTSQAWSSLGPDGIINFLTGEIRLSKTKCNDLFWEAVWPLLLARGWHSEKPANRGYATSKDGLVFLIPGVKKFSRTKLVKGDQYFDSVSDILSKVVAEPNLLGLGEEAEPDLLDLGEETEVGSSSDEEPERGSNKDDNYHRQRYLKPQASTYHADGMKFMIVDTSLVHGGKPYELREFKPAPVNLVGKVEVNAAADISLEGGKNTRNVIRNKDTRVRERKLLKVRELKDLPAEVEEAPKMTGLLRESKGISCDDLSSVVAATNMLIHDKKNISNTDDKYNAKKVVGNLKHQKTSVSNDTQPKRTRKRSRPDHSKHSVLPLKSTSLKASVNAEKMASSQKTVGDPVSRQKKAVSIPSTQKGEQSLKAMAAAAAAEGGRRLKANDQGSSSDTLAAAVKEPNGNSKRQSGRNRPMTVKAMESLANEFLHGPKRQKREHIETHHSALKARAKGKKMVDTDSSDSEWSD